MRNLGVALILAATWPPSQAAEPTLTTAAAAAATSAARPTAEEARRANDLAQAAYYEKQAQGKGDDRTPWWGPLLLGGFLGMVGSIATLVLTNRAAAKKAKQEQERLYQRHKLQVGLAVRGLIEALDRFALDGKGPVAGFLSRDLLLVQPDQPKAFDRGAPYYAKYDLVSTIYRLCALLGWMELYRIDPVFMSGIDDERARFESAFNCIRRILSDDIASVDRAGCEEAAAWSGDGVILTDDQRAIGEKMLTMADEKGARVVVGYAFFAETLFRYPGRYKPNQRAGEGKHADLPQDHWIWNATSFIVGIGDTDGPDLRILRLRRLLRALRIVLSSLLPAALQNGLALPAGRHV